MAGIETGLDRRGAIPHKWEGRPKNLPKDIAYAFTDDKLNANWRQLMEVIAQTLITGIMCVEGTVTYGSSDTTHCRLTLPDGYTELNDYLIIGDGSRVWRVKVLVANEIEFTNTQLISGSGASDYNTIQDSLRIVTLSKEKIGVIVTKNEISLGAFADALHGDDIRISQAIATTIKDLYDDYYTEHESDGTHSDDIIGNSNLKKDDVMITQGFVNILKNGAFNINGNAVINYWNIVGTPPTHQANANGDTIFPQYEAEIGTNAQYEGTQQQLLGLEPNIPIRLAFWAKGDAGGEKLRAQLEDGVSNAQNDIDLTTTWTKYYLTFTPVKTSVAYVKFLSNQAAIKTMYIALVSIAFGDVHTMPERSPSDAVYDAVLTKVFYVDDLGQAGDYLFAKWVLSRRCIILRMDAYAVVAVNADVDIEIDNGVTSKEVTILNTANEGTTGAIEVDYSLSNTLTMTVKANSDTAGRYCTIVIQYRTY